MFYEIKNSLTAEKVNIEGGEDFSFPPHLHSNFELITVTEGEMDVSVDGKHYTLGVGDALIIFPHQTHSLTTAHHSKHFLCIFSGRLVSAFDSLHQNEVPLNPRLTLSQEYRDRLVLMSELSSVPGLKGVLYSICADFDLGATYVQRARDERGLMSSIIDFVKNNYKGECTLATLSGAMSYSYVYLSKYFSRNFGTSFTDYVTKYRITRACYLLGNGNESVIGIALDSGFSSLRSFNRSFKSVMGITPTEYRKKLAGGA